MASTFHAPLSPQLRVNDPCGRIFCGPGWERTRENSLNLRDWELWLVWRGRGWMRTATGNHPLFAGFCALMRPGGIYDAGQDESDRLGISFIHFDILREATTRQQAKGEPQGGQPSQRRRAGSASAVTYTTEIRPPLLPTASAPPAPPLAAFPLLIEQPQERWPEFFLLDDVEYADLLTSRIIGLLGNNPLAATTLLYAFLADLLEREPIAAEAWVPLDRSLRVASQPLGKGRPPGKGRENDGRPPSGQTEAVSAAAAQRRIPHYRELKQLSAQVRTTSPELLPTVAQMASQMGLSPEHFSRLFRRVNGQSPIQFIVGLRMTHARHLLRESSLSVGEIADRLGYADVYFFSRQFKEQVGVSPLRYRRQS